jgi:hypothetical protein
MDTSTDKDKDGTPAPGPVDEKEYDLVTCITAGEIRSMGFQLPGLIPDRGWIPRASMQIRAKDTRVLTAHGTLEIDYTVSFLQPFTWVNLTAIIVDPHGRAPGDKL